MAETVASEALPPLNITSEWVQLCIANSDRLLGDSERVSPPTSVALCELALEEALKGVVLLYHVTDAPPRDISKGGGLSIPTEIAEFIRNNQPALMKIDPRSVFEDHRPKLDALRYMAGMVRLSVPHVSDTATSRAMKEMLGPAVSIGGFLTAPVMTQMLQLLTLVDENQARYLVQLKEQGLYVNLTDQDHLVSPAGAILPNPQLFRLYVSSMLGWLKGAAMSASRTPTKTD